MCCVFCVNIHIFSIFPSAIIGRYYEESLQYDLYYLVSTPNTLTTTLYKSESKSERERSL